MEALVVERPHTLSIKTHGGKAHEFGFFVVGDLADVDILITTTSIPELTKVLNSTNKSEFAAQREGKKNDALALKTILSGLSSLIKESMGQCTSTKDLWLKLEETYQRKEEKEDIEEHSIKITKGKKSPKPLDCIISKCDFENISSEDKESSDDSTKEDLEDISNKGKEVCVDVGKKEDHEDISNEGKEHSKTLYCNDDE
jgi:hypothetical protein